MNVRTSKAPRLEIEDQRFIDMLADAVHAEAPFASVHELSRWLHSAHPNPRVRYCTAADHRSLEVIDIDRTLLTIHLH